MHPVLQIIGGITIFGLTYLITGNAEVALVIGFLVGIVLSKIIRKK
jgi:uncharacterized membrane protein